MNGVMAMQFAVFILIIGFINLALGYGLAIYLGHASPHWCGFVVGLRTVRLHRAAPGVATEPTVFEGAASPLASGGRKIRTHVPTPIAPAEHPPTEPTVPAGPNSPVDLNSMLATAQSRLDVVQMELQARQQQDDNDGVDACRAQLETLCQELLEGLQQALESPVASPDGLAESPGARFDNLLLDQLAQLETTISNLRHRHGGAEPTQTAKELWNETERLRQGYMNLEACLR